MSHLDLDRMLEAVDTIASVEATGRVESAVGTLVRASLPGAAVGELAEIRTALGSLRAEVVGFEAGHVLLMPLGEMEGVAPGARVTLVARRRKIPIGDGLRGRIIDPSGAPLDGLGPLQQVPQQWPVRRPAPDPLARQPVTAAVETGLRVIDGLLPLGHGQRVGVFSGPGSGKSTLVRRLARAPGFDTVVIGLVGERGREVRGFVDALRAQGDAGVERTVLVVATSDMPAQMRVACAMTATTVAEYFRETHGQRVLLCIDSLTRVARAQREVGLAVGEPPVRRGYPPSLAGLLARLIERAGASARGTITAVYAVLTEGADDADDPVADEVRGLLDGHIVLSSELAERGHYPAVDVPRSLSRLSGAIHDPAHVEAARRVARWISVRARKLDLLDLGAYRRGADPELDEALEMWPELEPFVCQAEREHTSMADTLAHLLDLRAP